MFLSEFSRKLVKIAESQNKPELIGAGFHDLVVKFLSPIKLSSAPMLSGDTFRSFAQIKIDDCDSSTLSKLDGLDSGESPTNRSRIPVYVSLSGLDKPTDQQSFLKKISSLHPIALTRIVFLFHNADRVPSPKFFAEITSRGVRCYSVNILDGYSGVIPLPLGLENRWHRKNGVIRHFPSVEETYKLQSRVREVSVFGAFNVETNRRERIEAKIALESHGHVFESRLKPNSYRAQLRKSLFVLSPPGNGIDCHRTWESIYFGAIPVVKKERLASSLVDSLPIHEVEDWSTFCSLTRAEYENLYQSIISRPLDSAYFEYWKKHIESE